MKIHAEFESACLVFLCSDSSHFPIQPGEETWPLAGLPGYRSDLGEPDRSIPSGGST